MVQWIGKFRQREALSATATFYLAFQILFMLFTNAFIPLKVIRNVQNIHQHPKYESFKSTFILFSIKFLSVWMEIVGDQINGLQWKKYQWNILYLHKLIPIPEINNQFISACETVKKEFIIPRNRWNRILQPTFQRIADKFFWKQIQHTQTHFCSTKIFANPNG